MNKEQAKHIFFNLFEKWIFPPTCTLTGVLTRKYDLSEDIILSLLVVENECLQCATILAETTTHNTLCGQCLKEPPSFNNTVAGFMYEDYMKELITKYKFHSRPHLSRLLGELYCRLNTEKLKSLNIEAILPVPMHNNRLIERGFNQSLELSKIISKSLNIPLIPYALQKIKDTQPQAGLDVKLRKTNLNKSFAIDKQQLKDFKHIAIIDDVMTTGNTLNKLSEQVKRKTNIKTITALVIARA